EGRDSRRNRRRPKPKMDNKIMVRRASEDVSMKDLLKEIQKLGERQENYQTEAQKIMEEYNKQMIEMRMEIKQEIGQLKEEVRKTFEDIKELKQNSEKLENSQEKIKKKMEYLENKNQKIEKLQERVEQRELESQLRFRNLQEEENENIREKIISMTADLLQKTTDKMEIEIDRYFTYYSNRHESWSRIDMIWTSNSLTSKVDKINILLRDKSDHCPLEMIINYKRNHWRWRLDDNLIKSEKAILENRKLTKEFFNFNDKENVTKQTIWDSYKAVMRGYFIQQKARANKVRNYKIEQINN
uniref:Uncharacterized protein n=1 Tax=Anolis carolinensis TaxID=28377 RepID=G1KYR7_ANOCA